MNVDDQIAQLNQARQIVNQGAEYFSPILLGILPVCYRPEAKLQEWLASFLAEAFSTIKVDLETLQRISIEAIEPVFQLLSSTDVNVVVNSMSVCASIYSLVFSFVCKNQDEQGEKAWKQLSNVKSHLIQQWDKGSRIIKAMSIKFAQKVVLTQSVGIRDPRRMQQDDVSVSLVPSGHAFLVSSLLEAEAQGLLDRMLSILVEEPFDYYSVTTVLNTVSVIAKARGFLAPKIINSLVNYRNARPIPKSVTLSTWIQLRSCDRTCRATLLYIEKFHASGVLASKIKQYLIEPSPYNNLSIIEEENPNKRSLNEEDDQSQKRQKPDYIIDITPHVTATSSDEWKKIFQEFSRQNPLAWFQASSIKPQILSQLLFVLLQHLDNDTLLERLNNLLSIVDVDKKQQFQETANSNLAVDLVSKEEENVDEGYIANFQKDLEIEEAIAPIALLPAQEITQDQVVIFIENSIDRIFAAYMNASKDPCTTNPLEIQKNLAQPISLSRWTRTRWITLITRLPTRGISFSDKESKVFVEEISSAIRRKIFDVVVDNFKEELELALSWLSEEWYHEDLNSKYVDFTDSKPSEYERWTKRVLDHVLPFLDTKDRHIIVFFSELPKLTEPIIATLRLLCLDPDKSKLGYLILQYLVTFRPPVRDFCLNFIEKLWKENHEELKSQNEKFLKKWRPELIQILKIATNLHLAPKSMLCVHGGAGFRSQNSVSYKQQQICIEICNLVRQDLLLGAISSDCVVKAITLLEDNPNFNAGYGSSLDINGQVVCEAAIIDGVTGSIGCVAGLNNIKNPIQLAKGICASFSKQCARQNSCFLYGQGAEEWAQQHNSNLLIQGENLISETSKKLYDAWIDKLAKWLPGHDTVGAICVDLKGNMTIGSSSGGILLKSVGRIGPSCIPGHGFMLADYSEGQIGVCTTGIGEQILISMFAQKVADMLISNPLIDMEIVSNLMEKIEAIPAIATNATESTSIAALAVRFSPQNKKYEIFLIQSAESLVFAFTSVTSRTECTRSYKSRNQKIILKCISGSFVSP